MAPDNCYSCNHKVNKSSSRYITSPRLARFAQFLRFSKGFEARLILTNTRLCLKCIATSRKFEVFVKNSTSTFSESEDSVQPSTSATSNRELVPPKESTPFIDLNLDCLASRSTKCFICKAHTRTRVKNHVRYDIWLRRSIYVTTEARMCAKHLVGEELPDEILDGISDVNSSGSFSSTNIENLLKGLSKQVEDLRKRTFENLSTCDNDCTVLTSLSQDQFSQIHSTVAEKLAKIRSCSSKTALALLLVKLRMGISNQVISVFFQLKPTTVMNIIKVVLAALAENFVPLHFGLNHMSRADLIANHQSVAAVKLFASNNPDCLVTIVDGTYIRIGRSNDYTVLQKSFCVHKGQHIFKPMLLVTTTGYIIDIIGPYFANGRNNDARILNHAVKTREDLKSFFQENDVILADRGFRDSNTMLSELGVELQMPSFLSRGEKQVKTAEVNRSRKVTYLRWPVEVRNGHLQTKFKLFNNRIQVHMIPYITELLHLSASLINAFHPELHLQGTWEAVVEKMSSSSNVENALQKVVESQGLLRKPSRWQTLDEIEMDDFPVLTEEDVKDIVMSNFKYRRAESYVALMVEKCGSFDVEVCKEDNHILRVRIRSQFAGSRVHQSFIRYVPNGVGMDSIPQWYCTCKGGCLTLGTCAHVSSIIWYLAYRRHEDRGSWYQSKLRFACEDASELEELPNIV